MKLLLDTHAFLWLVEGSPNLSTAAWVALGDPANELVLSVASVWELAIKTGNKKLVLSDPLDAFVGKWTATYQLGCCRLLPRTLWRLSGCPIIIVTRSTECWLPRRWSRG